MRDSQVGVELTLDEPRREPDPVARARAVVIDEDAHPRLREVDDAGRDRFAGRDPVADTGPHDAGCGERHPRRAPLVALGLDVDHT